MNLVIGDHFSVQPNVLGFVDGTNGAGPHYQNRATWPDDHHVGAVFPHHIGGLSALEFPEAEDVLNAVGGVTAHETGHLYGLGHVDAGDEVPFAVMGTGDSSEVSDPLLNAERALAQRFASDSIAMLVGALGTVHRADFNMDQQITVSGDGVTLIANLGLASGAFMRHGDANNDGAVTVAGDGSLLVANLGFVASATTVQAEGEDTPVGEVEVIYNVETGEVILDIASIGRSANERSNIGAIVIEVTDGNVVRANLDNNQHLPDGNIAGLSNNTVAATTQEFKDQFLEFISLDGLFNGEDSLGVGVLAPGLDIADFLTLEFTPIGGQTQQAELTIIPEPTSIALLGLGGLALLRRRRVRE